MKWGSEQYSTPCPRQQAGTGTVLWNGRFLQNSLLNFLCSWISLDFITQEVEFICGDSCQKLFEAINGKLANEPDLHAPNLSEDFLLNVDSSNIGVGAVLQQLGNNCLLHLVSLFSKKLNPHQQTCHTKKDRDWSAIPQLLYWVWIVAIKSVIPERIGT